jgi:hypothetical protein
MVVWCTVEKRRERKKKGKGKREKKKRKKKRVGKNREAKKILALSGCSSHSKK